MAMLYSFSPGPWRLKFLNNTWALSAKGAKPYRGEPDIAQGSLFATNWRMDVALLQSSLEMLAALRTAEASITDPGVRAIVRRAIRKATTPTEDV